MINYKFTKISLDRPEKGLRVLNELADSGYRAVAWVPKDAKVLVFLERREVTVTSEDEKRCQGLKADGTPCGGWAIKDSAYCISHQDQDIDA